MDLRDLRAFVAIAETGSLAAAAKVLHSSPPSLSVRLKDLEDELGTALFERWARGLTLTEQGREFLSHAYAILKRAEDAKASMLSREKPPVGAVRFGVPGSLVGLLTAQLIETCLERFPQVRLRVVESMSGYIASWLREGTLDAAVVFGGGAATDRSASLRPIAEEELYIATYDRAVVTLPEREGRDPHARRPAPEAGDAGARTWPQGACGSDGAASRHSAEHRHGGRRLAADIRTGSARAWGDDLLPAARHPGSISSLAGKAPIHTFRIVDPGFRRTVHLATPLNRPSSRATMAVAEVAVETLLSLAATDEWKARRLK